MSLFSFFKFRLLFARISRLLGLSGLGKQSAISCLDLWHMPHVALTATALPFPANVLRASHSSMRRLLATSQNGGVSARIVMAAETGVELLTFGDFEMYFVWYEEEVTYTRKLSWIRWGWRGRWWGHIWNLRLNFFDECLVLYVSSMSGMSEWIEACRIWRVMDVILHSLEKEWYELRIETVFFCTIALYPGKISYFFAVLRTSWSLRSRANGSLQSGKSQMKKLTQSKIYC